MYDSLNVCYRIAWRRISGSGLRPRPNRPWRLQMHARRLGNQGFGWVPGSLLSVPFLL